MRVGRITTLKSEYINDYIDLHRNIWPEIEKAIYEYGITNYSIYLFNNILFSYYELSEKITLDELNKKWSGNPSCQKWEEAVSNMQVAPVENSNGKWIIMEEVFHQD